MDFPFASARVLTADKAGDLLGPQVRVIRSSGVPPKTGPGVWQPDLVEEKPYGHGFNVQEPRHVMSLRVDDFDVIGLGSIVEAQPKSGGDVIRWKVDGHEKQTVDWHHVILVRA